MGSWSTTAGTEWHVEPERRALARLALNADLPAHQLYQVLTNAQTQSGTAGYARGAVLQLDKGLEESGLLLRRKADAGVTDGESDGDLFRRMLLELGFETNRSLLGK